jgi:hypothetical protein
LRESCVGGGIGTTKWVGLLGSGCGLRERVVELRMVEEMGLTCWTKT